MRAVDATLACLKRAGVDAIFGLPGGPVIPLFDALHDDPDIRTFLVRHEQGAGHMAEGYAKVTGPGRGLHGHLGPGATNLVTPIADAYMDSVPLVAITGQVGSTPGRHRRLPGGRHRRHHPADREALLPDQGRRRPAPAPWPRPCTWPRPAAPARCWWTSASTSGRATSRTSTGPAAADARLPAARPAPATRASSRPPPGRSAGAERPVIYAGGGIITGEASRGAHPPVRAHRHPGEHHPDGPRRLPGHPPPLRRACPACTASPPPPTPSRPRTRSWPSGCASTSGCSRP